MRSLHKLVMPGLVPGIHVFASRRKTWMAGTSPAMTVWKGQLMPNAIPLPRGGG
ncbi:hypothetical protein ABIB82_005510 [Bradyrhizobium sp. i1.8.4]